MHNIAQHEGGGVIYCFFFLLPLYRLGKGPVSESETAAANDQVASPVLLKNCVNLRTGRTKHKSFSSRSFLSLRITDYSRLFGRQEGGCFLSAELQGLI